MQEGWTDVYGSKLSATSLRTSPNVSLIRAGESGSWPSLPTPTRVNVRWPTRSVSEERDTFQSHMRYEGRRAVGDGTDDLQSRR